MFSHQGSGLWSVEKCFILHTFWEMVMVSDQTVLLLRSGLVVSEVWVFSCALWEVVIVWSEEKCYLDDQKQLKEVTLQRSHSCWPVKTACDLDYARNWFSSGVAGYGIVPYFMMCCFPCLAACSFSRCLLTEPSPHPNLRSLSDYTKKVDYCFCTSPNLWQLPWLPKEVVFEPLYLCYCLQ